MPSSGNRTKTLSAVPPEFGAFAPRSHALTGVPAGDWPELTGEPDGFTTGRSQPAAAPLCRGYTASFSRSSLVTVCLYYLRTKGEEAIRAVFCPSDAGGGHNGMDKI